MVPCLVISSPEGVRVYSGFQYGQNDPTGRKGILEPPVREEEVAAKLKIFSADSLDTGKAWDRLSSEVSPDTRLNVRLLGNLKKLDQQLQSKDLPRETSHALIGKYVYLHYLRHRGSSPPRSWIGGEIPEGNVCGPHATLGGLEEVSTKLDEWLNGGVFPINFSRKSGLKSQHVKWAAGIFAGAEISGGGNLQLHLDFPAYDWVVGNPPWEKISLDKPQSGFANAAAWMKENAESHPLGNNEVSRAIAWKVEENPAPGGRAALLMPAMSLFETAAKSFRAKFLARFDVTTVANFSNLAEVLANGRFRVPAAALFFKHRDEEGSDTVRVFSPMVANHEVTRPREKNKRIESWVITIDASDASLEACPAVTTIGDWRGYDLVAAR